MRFIKPYLKSTIFAVFAKLMEAVFELWLPILMVTLIDNGIQKNDMNIVKTSLLWMLILTVVGYGFSSTCQYLASVISQRVSRDIRDEAFDHIQSLSLENLDTFTVASLTTRLTYDVNQVQEMIAKTIRLAIRAPIIMVGSLIALRSLNQKLFTILLMLSPIYLLFIVLFMYLSSKYHKQTQKSLDGLGDKVKETLDGQRIIRAFNKQKRQNESFAQKNQQLKKHQSIVGYIGALSNPTITLLLNLTLVLLVWVGAFEVNNGTMSAGQMIAVINYCTQLVLTMIVFMNLVMIFSRGWTSSLRIKELFNIKPSIKDEGSLVLENTINSVEFKDVSFAYGNQSREVLKDINFKLEKSKTMGIIGLTGSGKSTLGKLMVRLYEPKKGSILINGRPIQEYQLESIYNKTAYVSQVPQFLNQSVKANLLMGTQRDIDWALDIAQGNELLNQKDKIINQGSTNLSGGQKQRLNIARELAKHPSLLILDDSLSALDPATDKKLRDRLNEDLQDTIKVIISQKTSAIIDADVILVLEAGVITGVGTHTQLMNTHMLYKDIHLLQMEVTS